jgi:hypothetical protein
VRPRSGGDHLARPALRTPAAENARPALRERGNGKARKPLPLTDEQYRRLGGVADDFNIRGLAAQMNRIGGAINGTRPDRVVPNRLSNAA